MSYGKSIIVAKDTLVIHGLIGLVRVVDSDIQIETSNKLQDIAETDGFDIVFIHQQLFTHNLHAYLASVRKKMPHCRFVGLCTSSVSDNLCVEFHTVINTNDNENRILQNLRLLFDTNSSLTGKADGLLSERECEVLRAVAMGLTNKEISDNLFISAHTVITHRKNISAKLGIKTIAGLAVYAVLNGIISPDEMEFT